MVLTNNQIKITLTLVTVQPIAAISGQGTRSKDTIFKRDYPRTICTKLRKGF
jgi:hypothetical protein